MDERLLFVSRLLEGEAMTDVCREFGISRKTGCYLPALPSPWLGSVERSLAPGGAIATELPPQIEGLIVRRKRKAS
jgi:hypothetical protein